MVDTDTGLLTKEEADKLRTEILKQLDWGKRFWLPLSQRQDLWATMYYMLDVVQQLKPLGYRRFVTNEPRTAVDAGVEILTRNPSYWRIALNEFAAENTDERHRIGKIERTLNGVIGDIDDVFSMRGEPTFWRQVAQNALLRGWIWGKLHVTTDVLEYQEAPYIAEIFDSRTVYPNFDTFGLRHLLVEKLTNMGDLRSTYPGNFVPVLGEMDNPNQPAIKLEYWSNNRRDQPGIYAMLAMPSASQTIGGVYDPMTMEDYKKAEWIIWPRYHGYNPRALPVFGVPANGLNMKKKPVLGQLLEQRLQERAALLEVPTMAYWQNATNSWVAESGRSILSSVEEQVPQYNELIATIFQHFSIGTYGTWLFKTATGEPPEHEFGIESYIALRPEESAQRLEIGPVSGDAYRLVQILSDENQKGTLSNILRAVTPFEGTGVLFQQVANAALNALNAYHSAMVQFGARAGESFLQQLQLSAGELKAFEVSAPGPSRNQSSFVIEFDPSRDLESKRRYRPKPVFKPALPDDLAVRINAAAMALNPQRPILSLISVLENIIQVEDPALEIDRMWEDMATRDPVIVLEQIAMALERVGEPELAERIRGNEFKAKFAEELQWRQMTGQMPQQLQSGQAAPSEQQRATQSQAGGGEFNAQQRTARGETSELAAEGERIVASLGGGRV